MREILEYMGAVISETALFLVGRPLIRATRVPGNTPSDWKDWLIVHPVQRGTIRWKRQQTCVAQSAQRLPTEVCWNILAFCEERSTLDNCSLVCRDWLHQVHRRWGEKPIRISRDKSLSLNNLLQSPYRSSSFRQAIRNVRLEGDGKEWNTLESVLSLLAAAGIHLDHLDVTFFHKPTRLRQLRLSSLNVAHLTLRFKLYVKPQVAMQAFKDLIIHCQSLESLVFEDITSTTRYGRFILDREPRELSPRLKRFSWNFLGNATMYAVERHMLYWVLERNPKLESLHLIDRDPHIDDVDLVRQYLQQNQELKHLEVSLEWDAEGQQADQFQHGCTFIHILP